MGLFGGKKKEVIPDVGGPAGGLNRSGSTTSSLPSYRTAPSYVPPSQGGAGYGDNSRYARNYDPNQQQGYGQQAYQQQGGRGYPQQPPPHQQQGGRPDPYARQASYGRSDGAARNELLSGGRAPASGGSRYDSAQSSRYGGDDGQSQGGYQQHEQTEEDEEVEGIKQQMRFVKQESLASTRNAVRIAREAEETARATLDKLGEQSDRIANTERHLDLAKAHNDRAVDETKELEALNRSIFRPNITFNKQKKRDKEEARILARHNAEKAEREDVRREQYESRQRIEGTYRGMDRAAENASIAASRGGKAKGQDRSRYQFEATESDDEVEDEIDGNLDELGGLAGRLKMLAMGAGQEVDAQNKKLGKLSGKVDILDNNVVRSTQRLGRVK